MKKVYNQLPEEVKYNKLTKQQLEVLRAEILKEIFSNYGDVPDNSIKFSAPLMRKLLLERFNGAWYISSAMKSILRKLDLSSFDWKDVCVAHIDFTGCNAIIDPQIVYCRKLENGVYPLDFSGMNFDYCSIEGSDFRNSKGVVYDLTNQYFDTSLGRKKGYYPITFIGNHGYKDSRFEGCRIISARNFYEQLMNDIRGQVIGVIKRVRRKEN